MPTICILKTMYSNFNDIIYSAKFLKGGWGIAGAAEAMGETRSVICFLFRFVVFLKLLLQIQN